MHYRADLFSKRARSKILSKRHIEPCELQGNVASVVFATCWIWHMRAEPRLMEIPRDLIEDRLTAVIATARRSCAHSANVIPGGYSALCGQGVPVASPQREAVGCGRWLISSEWRTNSANMSAKLPIIRKTMIRRVTGNRQVSRLASPRQPIHCRLT